MIRRARLSDVPALVEVEQSAFLKDRRQKLLKRTQKQTTEFPAGILVDVTKAGVIRGFVKAVRRARVDTDEPFRHTGGDYLYCSYLAVHQDHQQKGIGRRLMTELLRRFPLHAYLVTESKTCHAHRLYSTLGFTVTKRVPGHFFDENGKASCGYRMERPAPGLSRQLKGPCVSKRSAREAA